MTAPAQTRPHAEQTGLLAYVWRHTRWQQGWLLVLVLLSLPTYFLAFDLPRRIISGPIQGTGFPAPESTVLLFPVALAWPAWIGEGVTLFPGFQATRSEALLVLGLIFLAVVVANGLFKLWINTFKGKLGERTLRRLRYELVDRLLRFPVARVRRMRAAEAATIVKDETEPLGPFIGDAYVQPLYLGGQALTALAFILVQNLWLGLMAAGIVALQVLIVPRLRRRLIALGRERQLTARQLAGRVAEIVEGIPTIRANALTHYERADVSARLGRIYWIRFEIYQWKFLIKFLNNLLAQVTPFLFYIVGGFLVLQGRLDVGQLVAVIAAYRDLPGPLKELMDWDQQRIDADVKFAQVMAEFAGEEEMVPAGLQAVPAGPIPHLEGPIDVARLTVADEAGGRLLEQVSLTLSLDERVAVTAEREAEAEALAATLARLAAPSQGRITIGGTDLAALPEARRGRRLAYVGPTGFLTQSSLRDNFLYLLKQAPVRAADRDDAGRRAQEREAAEARRSANSPLDSGADWVDRSMAGATDEVELTRAMREAARLARLEEDIIGFGLAGSVDPDDSPAVAERVVVVRKAFAGRMRAAELAGLVEVFAEGAYHWQSTIGENLLFGALGPLQAERLIANEDVRAALDANGLEHALHVLGSKMAAIAVEMFEDLPEDHPFFAELTFMQAHEIGEYRDLLARLAGRPFARVPREERDRMIRLALGYVEPRHRMGLIDERLAADIVSARPSLRHALPVGPKESVEYYRADRYLRGASLLDNILFGQIVGGIAGARQRVAAEVRGIMREEGLDDLVFAMGLSFDVGAGGSRLTLAQRQKLELARALLKRPDYLVMNRPLPAVNAGEQAAILRDLLALSRDADRPFGVLWALPPESFLPCFDKVAAIRHGAVESFGPPENPASDAARTAHVARR